MHCFQAGRAREKRTSISCACVYNCLRTVSRPQVLSGDRDDNCQHNQANLLFSLIQSKLMYGSNAYVRQ